MNNINIESSSLFNSNSKVHEKVLKRFSAFDGVGMDLTQCETYDDALYGAGLDYTAKKVDIFLESGMQIPENFAVVKSDEEDRVLGIVGKQYQCVGNREAFSVAEELYNEGYARYETGGPVLGVQDKIDYSRTFLVMRGDDFKVADETFNQFTILRNSFDGSSGVSFQVVCQRVWCQNMATRYLGGKSSQLRINIQHSKTVEERVKQVRQIVLKRNEDIRLIQKEAAAFIGTHYSRKEFEQTVIPAVLKEMKLVDEGKERQRGMERVEQVVNQLIQAYNADDVQNWSGTAYRVILAIQDFETHSSPLKDTGNRSVYLNRVAKGMVLTTAVANIIASQANFDLKEFRG